MNLYYDLMRGPMAKTRIGYYGSAAIVAAILIVLGMLSK
jgi:hypothetical protein